MGLLDQLTSMVGGEKFNQYKNILSWIETQGGIRGLIDKFEQQGFGGIIQSWISSGENLPISMDQISSIFGSSNISALASKVGLNSEQTSSLIAEYLPKLVNIATPDGNIPDKLDLTSISMKLLKNKLFGS
ncbi:MAG TPA: YidB family protein [Arsenophonus sp.]